MTVNSEGESLDNVMVADSYLSFLVQFKLLEDFINPILTNLDCADFCIPVLDEIQIVTNTEVKNRELGRVQVNVKEMKDCNSSYSIQSNILNGI
jgi:hypothetical protein